MAKGMRSLRIKQLLSQIEMAKKADVSVTTIIHFESGRLRPSLRTRRSLAAAYGTTVALVEAACRLPVEETVAAA